MSRNYDGYSRSRQPYTGGIGGYGQEKRQPPYQDSPDDDEEPTGPRQFTVRQSLPGDYALRNVALVSAADVSAQVSAAVFSALVSPADSGAPKGFDLLINGMWPVRAEMHSEIQPGQIAVTAHQRSRMDLGTIKNNTVTAEFYQPRHPDPPIGIVKAALSFANINQVTSKEIDEDELVKKFLPYFDSHLLSPGQFLLMQYTPTVFKLTVTEVLIVQNDELIPAKWARLDQNSSSAQFTLDKNSRVNLKASISRPAANSLIDLDSFDLKDLAVGGLDKEIETIIRRAFTSRGVSSRVLKEAKIKHLKGILLYGPPGTGKTLMARELSRALKSHPPKIVNGPDVLSKWVGQSEENIRALFADAEKEFKERGMDSTTHVIIFDELDAICKARGSGGAGGTNVTDNIVNQLLTKMDGVEELENVFIIGMTNRIDLIDTALLRPGRLELQIEISLPNKQGRLDILNIVVGSAKKNHILADDVELDILAHNTRNFTGAEMVALWHAAFAFSRTSRGRDAKRAETEAEPQVKMEHFEQALKTIKPMHGANTDVLADHIKHGIIEFHTDVKTILALKDDLVEHLNPKSNTPIFPILLNGISSSGVTSLACDLALKTDAPSIQMFGPGNVIGKGPVEVINALNDMFELMYKSEQSILVIDRIEIIFRWISLGPRFVPDIVLALVSLLTKPPPKGNRLAVICTTNNLQALRDLEISRNFKRIMTVPTITSAKDLSNVLTKFNIKDMAVAIDYWRAIERHRGFIGIKTVINAILSVQKHSFEDPMAGRATFARVVTDEVLAANDGMNSRMMPAFDP